MELQTTIYIFVGLSFALYIGIAIWARAGSTSEFYAAGGSVHPVMNGMATAADWMSASERTGLDRVFLVAPSSTPERLSRVTEACRGFVYAAAVMGVSSDGLATTVQPDASAGATFHVNR